ncbi:MAG TPA: hypothetical protein VFH54_07660 [Mycobacteriales bacterium]|nr:hypothetical protein [Mycobacteriales bacterium]
MNGVRVTVAAAFLLATAAGCSSSSGHGLACYDGYLAASNAVIAAHDSFSSGDATQAEQTIDEAYQQLGHYPGPNDC